MSTLGIVTRLEKYNPMRLPSWRAERAMQILERLRPPRRAGRSGDRDVRVYYRFLRQYLAAGTDEARRREVVRWYPHVYQAYQLRYAQDTEWRQILEARLLTNESYQKIAVRFDTEPPVIKCYQRLFFHVRDRLQSRDWIHKIIRGKPGELATNQQGTMTAAQRGYLYRLFGYHGGPLVLDTVIAGLTPGMRPSDRDGTGPWFDDALATLVRSSIAAALGSLEIDQEISMRIMKMAQRLQRAAASRKSGRQAGKNQRGDDQFEKHVAAFLAGMDKWSWPDQPVPGGDAAPANNW